MAMEMHVLFRGPLPSKAALTRAIKELGFPLTITSKGSLDQQSGLMPMRLQREDSGLEFDVFDGRNAVEEIAGKDIDASLSRVASLRWTGAEYEMLGAMCIGAALAKLTGGFVLEEVTGNLMTTDDAIQFANEHLARTRMRQSRRRGTRPADLKRYLKPLLQTRPELVLIGRVLIVRPVRHILRAVLFEPSSFAKEHFYLWRHVAPLYDPGMVNPFSNRIYDYLWRVWQPHFEPLLLDVLAENVFSELGALTELKHFASDCAGARGHLNRAAQAYFLAGDRERAEHLIRETQQSGERGPQWAEQQRALLSGDVAAMCGPFHAREAAAARAWDLGENWEPSPFPVELPLAERHRSAEHVFSVSPW